MNTIAKKLSTKLAWFWIPLFALNFITLELINLGYNCEKIYITKRNTTKYRNNMQRHHYAILQFYNDKEIIAN